VVVVDHAMSHWRLIELRPVCRDSTKERIVETGAVLGENALSLRIKLWSVAKRNGQSEGAQIIVEILCLPQERQVNQEQVSEMKDLPVLLKDLAH
jgi:hypothetical protein